LEATFDGKVFRPTGAVELKPDTCVRLIVTDQSTADAFDDWQSLLTASEEDDCAAIQQALDEMDAGDHGTPWKILTSSFARDTNCLRALRSRRHPDFFGSAADIDVIYGWLLAGSAKGAFNWYSALSVRLEKLAHERAVVPWPARLID
jgi:hypothetical protein